MPRKHPAYYLSKSRSPGVEPGDEKNLAGMKDFNLKIIATGGRLPLVRSREFGSRTGNCPTSTSRPRSSSKSQTWADDASANVISCWAIAAAAPLSVSEPRMANRWMRLPRERWKFPRVPVQFRYALPGPGPHTRPASVSLPQDSALLVHRSCVHDRASAVARFLDDIRNPDVVWRRRLKLVQALSPEIR